MNRGKEDILKSLDKIVKDIRDGNEIWKFEYLIECVNGEVFENSFINEKKKISSKPSSDISLIKQLPPPKFFK